MQTPPSPHDLFEAAKQICAIIEDGALDRHCVDYYAIEEAFPIIPESDKTKPVIERAMNVRNGSAPDSAPYRIATNTMFIRYLGVTTNVLDILKQNPEYNEEASLLESSLEKATRIALQQIKFSPQYYDHEKNIITNFSANIENSGSLTALYNWKSATIEERKGIISNIVNHDFMKAIEQSGSSLTEIFAPNVYFLPLPAQTMGSYSPGVVKIQESLITEDDPKDAFIAAAHESGHHYDLLVKFFAPEELKRDAELLKGLDQLKNPLTRNTFKTYMYEHVPDEKFDFHVLATEETLKKLEELKRPKEQAKTPANRFLQAFDSLALRFFS